MSSIVRGLFTRNIRLPIVLPETKEYHKPYYCGICHAMGYCLCWRGIYYSHTIFRNP